MILKFILKANTKINKPALASSKWVRDYAEEIATALDNKDLTLKRLPRLDENTIYDDPYILNGWYFYDTNGNIQKAEFELIIKDVIWNAFSQPKKNSIIKIFTDNNFVEVK